MAPDVEDELFGDSARVVRATSTAVMRLMEQLQRGREEASRREADGHREAAQALAERQKAQHEAMRAIIAPARDGHWIEGASDRDVALTYAYAEAYSDQDDLARETRDSLRERIEARHGDVGAYVDEHISPEEVERVPIPEGSGLSPTQQRLVAARQETAEKWANVFQVSGEARASKWLAANLDESEKARIESRSLEDWASVDRSNAADARSEAHESEGGDAEAWLAEAEEHDAQAVEHDEQADLSRYGRGEMHQHDPALAQESRISDAEQAEARNAAEIAQGGRAQPLPEQIAVARKHRGQGRHKKPAARHARERENERGR